MVEHKHAPNLADDMLDGADEVAKFMRLTKRQVYHLVNKNALPLIRLDGRIRGRKSTILAHLEKLESMVA